MHNLAHTDQHTTQINCLMQFTFLSMHGRIDTHKYKQNNTCTCQSAEHVVCVMSLCSPGISSDTVVRPSSVSQEELLELIDKMNRDWRVSGLLVQLPLPGKHKGNSC